MPSESKKVVYAAAAADLGIAVSKFIAAALTGSAAMLAEAFHSAADTGNQLLLLIGMNRSKRPPDRQHPFGHGRELYFWAFVVALSVFAVGGGLSVYEGIRRLLHPSPLEDPTWSYVVLGIAAAFDGYSWSVAIRSVNRRRRPGESILHTLHNSKDPSVFTVLVEDSSDLIGLTLAFLGVLLSHLLNNPALDAVASILIGFVLVAASIALGIESAGLLIGEGADQPTIESAYEIIGNDAAVQSVANVLTMQLGPEEVLLVGDVSFLPQLGTRDLELAVERVEQTIRRRHPEVKRIYFDAEALSRGSKQNRAA